MPKRVSVILTFALIGIIKLALKMPTVRPAIAVVKSIRVARRAHANVTPQRVRLVRALETVAGEWGFASWLWRMLAVALKVRAAVILGIEAGWTLQAGRTLQVVVNLRRGAMARRPVTLISAVRGQRTVRQVFVAMLVVA